MKIASKLIFLIFFGVTYALQNIWHLNPTFVETYYSNGVNLYFRELQGIVFGVFPFSVAEVVVVFGGIGLGLWGIFMVTDWLRRPIRRFMTFGKRLMATLLGLMVLYGCFVLFWGLNYQRPSFLPTEQVVQSTEKLEKLCTLLASQANAERLGLDPAMMRHKATSAEFSEMQNKVETLYQKTALDYPALRGHFSKPKAIVLSRPFSYTGIVGIYFPFTGEANVNTNEVPFLLSSTMAHEMAHQRGYAKEEDANFIAYLVMQESDDQAYQYAGTLLALIHASNRLYEDSPEAYQRVRALYGSDLVSDLQFTNTYWAPYRGKVEEKATKLNDNYLKSNGQKAGVVSYSLMIKLLLAYYEDQL